MKSIQEYSEQAGVSPRAVRFQVAEGRIPARKVGGQWMIENDRRPRRRGAGRRLSSASFDQLAAFLDGEGSMLSSDQRRRAKERAQRILERGMPEVRRDAERPDISVERYRASEEDFDELRSRDDLVLTGISHPDAEVYGRVVDAYVSSDIRDQIVLFHMLEEADAGSANVVLRVQDSPPAVRRLHVVADLLDDRNPRSRAEAARLLAVITDALR